MKPTRYIRAEIMLDPTQHRKLTRMARHENRTFAELVRDLIDAQLAVREQAEWDSKKELARGAKSPAQEPESADAD
jgi:hypothetical protein